MFLFSFSPESTFTFWLLFAAYFIKEIETSPCLLCPIIEPLVNCSVHERSAERKRAAGDVNNRFTKIRRFAVKWNQVKILLWTMKTPHFVALFVLGKWNLPLVDVADSRTLFLRSAPTSKGQSWRCIGTWVNFAVFMQYFFYFTVFFLFWSFCKSKRSLNWSF